MHSSPMRSAQGRGGRPTERVIHGSCGWNARVELFGCLQRANILVTLESATLTAATGSEAAGCASSVGSWEVGAGAGPARAHIGTVHMRDLCRVGEGCTSLNCLRSLDTVHTHSHTHTPHTRSGMERIVRRWRNSTAENVMVRCESTRAPLQSPDSRLIGRGQLTSVVDKARDGMNQFGYPQLTGG